MSKYKSHSKKAYYQIYIQPKLDYPHSLGPHEIARIIENVNINETKTQQNWLNYQNDMI